MAFLRTSAQPSASELVVDGEGVYARYPTPSDYDDWARVRDESRSFLTPWEPTWAPDDLSRPAFRKRLRRYAKDIRDDEAHPFFFFRASDDALLGGCTFSNIRRGAAAACSLGYWIGAPYRRRGYTFAAVQALIPYVLDAMRLHRVEAACLPENVASRQLLLKAGFRQEGRARHYLRINGAWRDHLLFAMLRTDLESAAS
ncbi:MAG: GNAT family protein [Pseudomonadota bacterium]